MGLGFERTPAITDKEGTCNALQGSDAGRWPLDPYVVFVASDEARVEPAAQNSHRDPSKVQAGVASHIAETVEELQAIDARDRETMSARNRLADVVTRRSGSLRFVAFHVVWFTTWLALNIPDWQFRFDPFPFGLLTTIVSLEAILLSVFILMSENRQAQRDERHARVDLQVNLIAEREVTKVITMLAELRQDLGLQVQDEEVDQMNKKTKVQDLVEAVDSETVHDRNSPGT